jgi:hypothetical protein
MKKTEEQKAAEALVKAIDSVWFNPEIFANLIVNEEPLYTQDRLMDLMSVIISYQARREEKGLEHNYTSNGLRLASYLDQVIKQYI